MDNLQPGDVVGSDFRVERAIAEGGMGAVYLVRQMSTDRQRALKVMHRDLAQDDDMRRRFLIESRVGARIPSAHIVEVVAAGFDDPRGLPYLVMELLEGEDLAARLRRAGPLGPGLDLGSTRELFRQLCHGIGAAHGVGVVHRDMKPANIFLAEPRGTTSADFDVKVLDFGVAKLTQLWQSLAASRGNALIGTPQWMAPEQSETSTITPAADVWSLGLILYTTLTGRSYWRFQRGASLSDVMRETLFEPLVLPSVRATEQGVTFPEALNPIFEACVARDPLMRYRDATSLWLSLDAAFSAGPIKAGRPQTTPPSTERMGGGEPTVIDLAYERTYPVKPR